MPRLLRVPVNVQRFPPFLCQRQQRPFFFKQSASLSLFQLHSSAGSRRMSTAPTSTTTAPIIPGIPEVTPAWLQEQKLALANGTSTEKLLHIDVRRREELQADGRIPGALHVPLHLLAAHHLQWNSGDLGATKDEVKLVFSCLGGHRSMQAAQKAVQEWGFTNGNVMSMAGGFKAWKVAELPVLPGAEFPGQPMVQCLYDQPTGTCQYVVTDVETKDTVIIDPVLDFDLQKAAITTRNADLLLAYVHQHQLQVKYILETHAHADHLTASQYLKQKLGGVPAVAIGEGIRQVQLTFAKMFAIEDKVPGDGHEFDHLFQSGEAFQLGSLQCRALHVPGHTPDHLCYVMGESVFAGDSIFMPDSGSARCDFPGGSAPQLFQSIRLTLFALPDTHRLFVGHDYQPGNRVLQFETTIGEEKRANTHVKESVAEAEFIKMRQERDATLGNPKLLFPSLQVNIRAGHLPDKQGTGRSLFIYPVTGGL